MSQQCYAKTIDPKLLKLYDWGYKTAYFKFCRNCPGRENCLSCRVARSITWEAVKNSYEEQKAVADEILEAI